MSDVEKCGCEESQDLALALGVALSTLRDRGVEVSGLAGMTVTLIKERDELRLALESARRDLRESVIREYFIVKGVLATIDAALAPQVEPKSTCICGDVRIPIYDCCLCVLDARIRRGVIREIREALPKAGLYLAEFYDVLDAVEAKS